MLNDLSLSHLLIIFVIILVVFGSKRMPELGAGLGKGIREFKRSLNDVRATIEEQVHSETPISRRMDNLPSGEPKKLSE